MASYLRGAGFLPRLSLALLLAGICLTPASAQIPGNPCPPPVPVLPPKVAEVSKFVEGVGSNDSIIEVVNGQSRILVVKEQLQTAKKSASIFIGDPNIADVSFVPPTEPNAVTPNLAIRIVGKRFGVTDLVITTPDNKIFKFEIRVVADLDVLNLQLHTLFPDASLRVTQLREHLIVEGQARTTAQVARIMETVRNYVASLERTSEGQPVGGRAGALPPPPGGTTINVATGGNAAAGEGAQATAGVPSTFGQVINLIHVPTSQQVLLKVRVAELNRTAMRAIGSDFLAFDTSAGNVVGTSLGNSNVLATGTLNGSSFTASSIASTISGQTTAFGIFSKNNFEMLMSALRQNNLLKILAEPNLVALNGQRANFLAGGQFFIPVAQSAGTTTGTSAISAQPVDFGVRLEFLAHILDNDVIRLTVDPEVSQPDFTIATTFVAGGSPTPGLNKRSAHTTVELKPGQTLAIAGLMSLTLDGTTRRIPGLGDLPILGPFFSNTTGTRTEKELIVLVTPYLVEPMNPDQVGPTPGDEVKTPTDLEFYLLGRLEGRTGHDFRSTTEYDDATHTVRCLLRLHEQHVRGPYGYCD
jgi:pilus assembly protein CpaC